MSILEQCEKFHSRLYENTGVTCSVIRLCETHNLALAEEINKTLKDTRLHTKRVRELFGKPVIEESKQGRTLCLICENL